MIKQLKCLKHILKIILILFLFIGCSDPSTEQEATDNEEALYQEGANLDISSGTVDNNSNTEEETASSDIYPIEVPILMYHEVKTEVTDSGVVTPEKFRADMKALQEAGYEGIFFSDLYEYLANGKTLPEKPIIITFDDGYRNNYTEAFPICESLQMKITISVIGWSVGRDTFVDSETPITPHFTWNEAKEMEDSGWVDIQHHTYDLHSPEGLSYGYGLTVGKGVLPMDGETADAFETRFLTDINQLSLDMEEVLGASPEFLVYPYGLFNEETEKMVHELGFHGSVTTVPGVRSYDDLDDLWLMPRINVLQELSSQSLIELIESY